MVLTFPNAELLYQKKVCQTTMVFGCFDPITGGRVNGIVSQESRLCGKKNKDSLPLSRDEDKFEMFCETYKDYIGISKSHERFARIWEDEKKNAGATLMDKLCIPLLLCALFKSFPGDFYKAVVSKLMWSVLIIFLIWFFIFKILDFIKARSNAGGVAQEMVQNLALPWLLPQYVCALNWHSANGYVLKYLGLQGQGCSYNGDLQEDDC
jgi:hypothetical protein